MTLQLTIYLTIFCLILSLSHSLSPESRALDLVNKMTLQEKLMMVSGVKGDYVGNTLPIERLGIPALHLEDGPQGVADNVWNITCWPSALTVVASWDRDLMARYGAGLGKEQRGKGTNVMLGPMVNIARVPLGGRNFESFGEDPYLSSEMARSQIPAIQKEGVMACAKHWVNNNQEHDRTTVSANVDERTRFEIYYPAFQAAIDVGVGSFMCSYNKINDVWACENDETLNQHLKNTMGFKGFVMSDWGATHSTVASANNGLDQEMPDNKYFGLLKQAVGGGYVSNDRLDNMVYRILLPMIEIGLLDNPQTGDIKAIVTSKEHDDLARLLSEESTVLLQNINNILPLSKVAPLNIAVLGDDASIKPIIAGGGSGGVNPPYIITPLEGIKKMAPQATINYAGNADLTNSIKYAKEADIVIVFAWAYSHEGADRESLSLPENQDNYIEKIAAVNKHVIVVLHVPGAVLMPWAKDVSAIVCAFMPGQEDGNAIASVLFGETNPSGRLPLTFPLTEDQTPINTPAQYPGINDEAFYSEKLLVGYRWYTTKNIIPLFEFGKGLSYTTFEYSNIKLNGLTVSFTLKNTGKIAGKEVPQLYLTFPSSAEEPIIQLRGFQKISLQPNQSKVIILGTLTTEDFMIWDIQQHDWTLIKGNYTIHIASSSQSLHLSTNITIN